MRADTSVVEKIGLRMLGIGSKPMHLSSENGSSVSSKPNPSVGDLSGGGIRVRRVRRCLRGGGGGGGLRWLDFVGLRLREREIGPVVVEIRQMGLFLEDEFMKGKDASRGNCGVGRVRDIYTSVGFGPSTRRKMRRQRPSVSGGGVGNELNCKSRYIWRGVGPLYALT
jgi:hypothetical protein